MSGVISIGAALAATAIAVEVGTTFAIIAAVGATVGAVGALTGVKELQIAGSVLGAVGGIGSLASSAGLFSGAADAVASATGGGESFLGAVGGADEISSFANVTAQMAPAGGYTTEMLGASGLATAEGLPGSSMWSSLSGVGEGAINAGQSVDIVDMVNGVSETNFNPLPITEGAQTPNVTPEVLPDTTVNPLEPTTSPALEMDPSGEFPNMYQQGNEMPGQVMVDNSTQPQGLIESAGTTPQDQFGNPIAQGGDTGGAQIGPGVSNPAQAQPIDPAASVPGTQGGTPAGTAPTGAESVKPIDPGAATPTVGTEAPGSVAPGSVAQAQQVTGVPGTVDAGKSLGATAAADAAGKASDPSIWSSILDFTRKNQGLTMGGISAAASFLSGAMSPLNPAQVKKLEAEAASNQAAANLAKAQEEMLRRRMQNLSGPQPMATRREPTPQGQMPGGLINSAQAAGAAVTGRPA